MGRCRPDRNRAMGAALQSVLAPPAAAPLPAPVPGLDPDPGNGWLETGMKAETATDKAAMPQAQAATHGWPDSEPAGPWSADPPPDGEGPANIGDTILYRLGCSAERLEDASLQPGWVVHEVRKDMKRVRALLRLASDRVPTRPLEQGCAAAARRLAPLRDADAASETVGRLRMRANASELKALDKLGQWFMRHREETAGTCEMPRALAMEVAGSLREIESEAQALPFEQMDAAALDAGLADAWVGTAKAFRKLVERPTSPRFHDFRKAAKRELHQRELSGRPLDRVEWATLKKLADVLGELQDLYVLREVLRETGRWRGRVRKLIDKTMLELKSRALRLGESRYPESRP